MSMHLYQEIGFTIIVVYVDYLNLVETLRELTRTTKYLKKELEMKDLGKTKKKNFLACRSSICLLEFWFTNQYILRKFLSNFIWIKHTL